MTRNIYIASPEGASGKSTIALGVTALLARTVGRVGIFRPVARVADGSDYVLRLLLGQDGTELDYEVCVGVTYEQVHDDAEAALATIVSRYHEVADRCDAVVIVGTDYTDVSGAAEFEFNGRIAANLGAPVVLVVHGRDRSPADVAHVVAQTRQELLQQHARPAAVIVNRCIRGQEDDVARALERFHCLGVLPEEPILSAPELGQLAEAVDGVLLSGDEALLARETRALIVGAMTVPNLLERLQDDAVIITPGDRADALLALVTAHVSEGFPSLSGIVLTGGIRPEDVVLRLLEGLGTALPIILAPYGTIETATRCAATRGRLTGDNQLKVDTALNLFERHVDTEALARVLDVARTDVVTPLMFEYDLLQQARAADRHIVLPEGNDDRILRAASTLLTRGVVRLTLLGDEAAIRTRAGELGVDVASAQVISPGDPRFVEPFAKRYLELRRHKGVTPDAAHDAVQDVSCFGTLMVLEGMADGMVSGAAHTTAHTITPALQLIRTAPGVSLVSSVFFMCLADRVLVYGDCAINPDPTAEQLAEIAISSAATARQFSIEPRVAMLSWSTGASGHGQDVEKVREATRRVRERCPELVVDGPMQYDAAVDPGVGRAKAPGSDVAGHATVLVFPDLNTGNNTYKAVQRSANAVAVGPVLQGLRQPVNDLSRGATVKDIVNTVAITAVQSAATSPEAGL